jgi:hypothetical protein
MKSGAKVTIVVVIVVLILLMCCCVGSALGWFFVLGPGSYQTTQADKLVASTNTKYNKAISNGKEMESAASDLVAKLTGDTSTASIKSFKDSVIKLESKAQENIDELDSANKDLTDAKKLRLPAWYQTYVETLVNRNTAAKSGFESLQNAYSESSKMADSLSYVIDGVDRITTAFSTFDQITTAMESSDYNGALAKINAADGSLVAGETALKTANEIMKSQDISDMITLSEKFRAVLPIMTRFIQAAQALDIATMTTLQTELTTKLDAASAAADSVGATGDFGTWLKKSITKYEDEYVSKMKEANKYDDEAKAIHAKNAG